MTEPYHAASPIVPLSEDGHLIAHVPASELLQAEAAFRRGEELNSSLRDQDDPQVGVEVDLVRSLATFHFNKSDFVVSRRAVLNAAQALRSSTLYAHEATGPFSDSDILTSTDERIAHLDLKPEELADHIIVVGDPARTLQIGRDNFAEIEVERSNRGLLVETGYLKSGLRISIVTHGMGAGSAEIVLNEIHLLKSVDFETMALRPLEEVPQLKILRVGTCGAIQDDTVLGRPLVSVAATSLDVGTQFFHSPNPKTSRRAALIATTTRSILNDCLDRDHPLYNHLPLACFEPSQELLQALRESAFEKHIQIAEGVTFTSPGFNHTQGREVGGKAAAIPALDRVLAKIELPDGLRFENFEMEAATVLALAGQYRHLAGVICVPVAQRATERAIDRKGLAEGMSQATQIALGALELISKRA